MELIGRQPHLLIDASFYTEFCPFPFQSSQDPSISLAHVFVF